MSSCASLRGIVSAFTTDYEILKEHWKCKKDNVQLPDSLRDRFNSQEGLLLGFDGKMNICYFVKQKCPFGMSLYNSTLFVCDAKENAVYQYSCELEKIGVCKSKYFSDIHSIEIYDCSHMIITSSGYDALVMLNSLTMKPHPIGVFEYTKCKSIRFNRFMRGFRSSRVQYAVPTERQITHINYAIKSPIHYGSVIVSLFHQGIVAEVDICTGRCEVLVENLNHPHSFFFYKKNVFVADSGNHRVNIYDSDSWKMIGFIDVGGWVQEIRLITHSLSAKPLFSVINADYSVVYIVDIHTGNVVQKYEFDSMLRLSSCIFFE
ncbi:MAG: YncE family protein [Desulfovibrio sp.]